MEGKDRGILKAMKDGTFVLTHHVDGVLVKKSKKDWTKDNKENAQRSLKANIFIITALGLDEFL